MKKFFLSGKDFTTFRRHDAEKLMHLTLITPFRNYTGVESEK